MWTHLSLEQAVSKLVRDEVVIRAFEDRYSDGKRRLWRLSRGFRLENADHDLLNDVLSNDARLYLTFHSPYDSDDGDDDEFAIEVKGLGGVYFAHASEFDDVGLFDSLENAERGVYGHWAGLDVSLHQTHLPEFTPPPKAPIVRSRPSRTLK